MTTIELYKNKLSQYRWRVTSGNGEVIGASTQGYTRKVNCMKNISMVFAALRNVIVLPATPQPGYRIIDTTCKVEVVHG
jgi:uncharacterized protein YegP (UPF0339 family)